MEKREIIRKLSQDFDLPAENATSDGTELLATAINDLLNNNFQKLIFILYRMDINESKLRQLLEENQNENSGLIIAELMIEREMQKIKSRQETKPMDPDSDLEEKW